MNIRDWGTWCRGASNIVQTSIPHNGGSAYNNITVQRWQVSLGEPADGCIFLSTVDACMASRLRLSCALIYVLKFILDSNFYCVHEVEPPRRGYDNM